MQASDGSMKLLKVIKNPVTDYFPAGCKKILMSYSAKTIVLPKVFVPKDDPIIVVIGAMAHGKVCLIFRIFFCSAYS